jgi:hypothetical protein
MDDIWPLPDRLLLKAVDIILADRQTRFSPEMPPTPTSAKAMI